MYRNVPHWLHPEPVSLRPEFGAHHLVPLFARARCCSDRTISRMSLGVYRKDIYLSYLL
jgi:hypothetical protein